MTQRAMRHILATACTIVAITAGSRTATAGFFESLFGVRPPPEPVYVLPPPGPDPAEVARDEARRRAREFARQAALKKAREAAVARIMALQSADPGALDVFVADDTLRPGDVVVTQAGFLVFQGSPNADHDAGDFAPISDVRQLKNRTDLIALQNAAKLARPTVVVAAAKPAAAFVPIVSAATALQPVDLQIRPVSLKETRAAAIR